MVEEHLNNKFPRRASNPSLSVNNQSFFQGRESQFSRECRQDDNYLQKRSRKKPLRWRKSEKFSSVLGHVKKKSQAIIQPPLEKNNGTHKTFSEIGDRYSIGMYMYYFIQSLHSFTLPCVRSTETSAWVKTAFNICHEICDITLKKNSTLSTSFKLNLNIIYTILNLWKSYFLLRVPSSDYVFMGMWED